MRGGNTSVHVFGQLLYGAMLDSSFRLTRLLPVHTRTSHHASYKAHRLLCPALTSACFLACLLPCFLVSFLRALLNSDHLRKKNCSNNPRCLYGLGEGKEVKIGSIRFNELGSRTRAQINSSLWRHQGSCVRWVCSCKPGHVVGHVTFCHQKAYTHR